MNIETEQLKLRLIESQMQVLQYQYRDVTEGLQKLQQTAFDASADSRDMPSGATTQPDQYAGS